MGNRFTFLFALMLFLTAFASNCAMASKIKKVSLAGHPYPPYYNEDGQGLIPELYQEIFKGHGVEFEFRILPIKRSVQELMSLEVDGLSPGDIFLTASERSEVYTKTFFSVGITWLFFKTNFSKRLISKSTPQVTNETIAIIVNSPFKDSYEKKGIHYTEVENPIQSIKMVKDNRVQFAEITQLSALFLLDKLYKKEGQKFQFLDKEVLPLGVSFLKKNIRAKKISAMIDQGLKRVMGNGKYIEVFEGYWGKGNIPKKILPEAIRKYGVEKVNIDLFYSYKRNAFGKIIK